MNRIHIHVGVETIPEAITFYATLFGAEPTMVKDDYARWMLDDPRVNFAISAGGGAKGIRHLGLQSDAISDLTALTERLQQQGFPTAQEDDTTCCYAQSDKTWVRDPIGVNWEAFVTSGAADTLRTPAETACCAC
ncbi:MAG: ArsI/CadI family heavy metal resistance metalloenzyme [Pseudomonadota bacterium]